METKWTTLSAIYSIVKDYPNPTATLLHINELLLNQSLPWDQVVDHLKELQKEEFVTMKQLSVAAISLTEKGMQYLSGLPKANIAWREFSLFSFGLKKIINKLLVIKFYRIPGNIVVYGTYEYCFYRTYHDAHH